MSKLFICALLLFSLVNPVHAAQFAPPEVPESGTDLMPDTENFGDGLQEMILSALDRLHPYLSEACRTAFSIITAVVAVSLLKTVSDPVSNVAIFAGCTAVAVLMMQNAGSMIQLGQATVMEISEYGKLLLPVMTAALASQGGVTSSAALYTGTAVFTGLLGNLISKVFLPMVYLFLALATGAAALENAGMRQLRDLSKNFVSWCLKTLLILFTTYMSITGVVSGTTDTAVLKTTKVTISSVVPVVGGILSDASEAVLVSAGLMKNAAGIYGIFAVLAVFLLPFLRVGVQYLLLKFTAAVCSIFAPKSITELIGDFSTAMGLLLAMTGSVCLLQLISTVCFMKGAG